MTESPFYPFTVPMHVRDRMRAIVSTTFARVAPGQVKAILSEWERRPVPPGPAPKSVPRVVRGAYPFWITDGPGRHY